MKSKAISVLNVRKRKEGVFKGIEEILRPATVANKWYEQDYSWDVEYVKPTFEKRNM